MKRLVSILTAVSTFICMGLALAVVYLYEDHHELGLRLGWIACGFGMMAMASGVSLQLFFSRRL